MTAQQLQDVYKMKPTEGDNEEKAKAKKDFVTWYFDHWLPACAGVDHYGHTKRWYKKATAPVVVNMKLGLKVPLVPMQAEALGFVIMENCESKWKHIVPKKAADPNWKVPVKSKDTAKYHKTKWSDSNTGQVKGGGWHEDAVTQYSNHLTNIEKFRGGERKDEKDKKVTSFYTLGLEYVREKNQVQTDVHITSKKRKRSSPSLERKKPVAIHKVKDSFSDDEEDAYSLQSDDELDDEEGDNEEVDDAVVEE